MGSRKKQNYGGSAELPGFEPHTEVVATPHAPVRIVVDRFHALYVHAYGTKPAIPPRFLRDLKAHVERTGTSEALRRLDVLFELRGPKWLKPPFDLGTFVAQYDKLVIDGGDMKPSDFILGGRR